jgi:hypothetical protein
LPSYRGLIVKDSYWRWPERNLAGNAIDLHVQVLGLSFHDAMRQITLSRRSRRRRTKRRWRRTARRQSATTPPRSQTLAADPRVDAPT